MKVSSAIEVNSPLMMARVMIANVGHGMPMNWKYAIVPRSPMEQPSRHHDVLMDACFQVGRQAQSMDRGLGRSVVSAIRESLLLQCT